jgi:hypothetical protein
MAVAGGVERGVVSSRGRRMRNEGRVRRDADGFKAPNSVSCVSLFSVYLPLYRVLTSSRIKIDPAWQAE